MARTSNTDPLNRLELDLWRRAFLDARKALLASHDGRLSDKPGLTRLCEELAWEAVDAFRRAVAGERPRAAR